MTLRLRRSFGDSSKSRRPYNNKIDTICRAVDAIYGCPKGLRALVRLKKKWPETNWPEELGEIFVSVIFEPPPLGLPSPIGGAQ